MSIFNERSHAFIVAKYYEHLVESFDKRGREAFIHGTQYYSSQRGRRMAQRAIRDGKDLTYETYCQYGERIITEEIKKEGIEIEREIISKAPDYISNIKTCPWQIQFNEMGANDAGLVYCTHLDNSICRGFNPYLIYEVDLSNLEKKGYCTHKVHGVSIEDMDIKNRPENLISFEYHCAHSYWSFKEVSEAIFGFEGTEISYLVLREFGEEYGKESIDSILKYKYTNFNVTY